MISSKLRIMDSFFFQEKDRFFLVILLHPYTYMSIEQTE